MRREASLAVLVLCMGAPAANAQAPTVLLPRVQGQAPAAGPTEARGGQVATPTTTRPPLTLRRAVEEDAPSGVAGVPVLLRQAEAARQRGRKDLAARAIDEAARRSPANPEVIFRRGLYAAQDRRFEAALSDLMTLRARLPSTDRRLADIASLLPPGMAPVLAQAAAPPIVAPPQQVPASRPSAPPPALRTRTDRQAAPRPVVNQDPGGEARAAGFNAFNSGDLAGAERLFNQALKLRSSDLDATGGLGVLRLRQRRFSEAQDLLERASRNGDGRWAEALRSARFYAALERARAHLLAGRFAQAERDLRALPAADARDQVEGQLLLGQALSAQSKFSEAEGVYRSLRTQYPSRKEVVPGLVEALLQQGKIEAAAELAGQVNDLSADTRARIARARANDLSARGDAFGAGASLATAFNAAPNDPWTRYEYAKFLAGAGQGQQAAEVAAPLFSPQASDPQTLQAAALYAEFAGKIEQASSLLARVPNTARTPAVKALAERLDAQAAIVRAEQLRKSGQKNQAVSLLRGYAARSDLSYSVRSRLAQALMEAGDLYQAGALALAAAREPAPPSARPGDAAGFLAVLAAGGQDQLANELLTSMRSRIQGAEDEVAWRRLSALNLGQRADRLRLAGDFANAFDVLSQALEQSPRDPELMAALARLYQSGGLPAQAVQVYATLLASRPNDPALLLDAGRAAIAAQDYNEGAQLLRRAQALRPNDAELQFELGKLEQARGRDREALRAFERAEALLRVAPSTTQFPGVPTATGVLGANPFRAASTASPVATTFAPPQSAAASFFPSDLQIAAAGAASPAPLPSAQAPSVLPPVVPQAPTMSFPVSAGGAAPYQIATEASAPLPNLGLPAPLQQAPRLRGPLPASAPLAARITQELETARLEQRPTLEGGVDARVRSGEAGSSQLTEITGRVTASIAGPAGGKLSASIQPTVLNAGVPVGDGARRVGANPLIAAEQIAAGQTVAFAAQESRQATGVGLSAAFDNAFLHADVGVTPLGFQQPALSAGLRVMPKLGPLTLEASVEQRPVTDSLLAYAGDEDPITGLSYGALQRVQASLGVSGLFGPAGFYAQGAARRIEGLNVARNSGYEVNAGAYYRPIDDEDERLQVGFNLSLQGYEENLRYFTLGHGGYFSPQSFVSASVPISYTVRQERWWFDLNVTPGIQSYKEAAAPLFPLFSDLQRRLVDFAVLDQTIQAFYPGSSTTGFGISGRIAGEYSLTPTTALGGMVTFNNFGRYSETWFKMYLRQLLGK